MINYPDRGRPQNVLKVSTTLLNMYFFNEVSIIQIKNQQSSGDKFLRSNSSAAHALFKTDMKKKFRLNTYFGFGAALSIFWNMAFAPCAPAGLALK
jgi:hypothetical protein